MKIDEKTKKKKKYQFNNEEGSNYRNYFRISIGCWNCVKVYRSASENDGMSICVCVCVFKMV